MLDNLKDLKVPVPKMMCNILVRSIFGTGKPHEEHKYHSDHMIRFDFQSCRHCEGVSQAAVDQRLLSGSTLKLSPAAFPPVY